MVQPTTSSKNVGEKNPGVNGALTPRPGNSETRRLIMTEKVDAWMVELSKRDNTLYEQVLQEQLREQQAYAEVERLVGELAEAAAPIARHGDGNCGAVIHLLFQALSDRGLYSSNGGGSTGGGYRKKEISRTLQKKVFERDAYRCVTCGTHIDLSCDHIIPESKGGPTTLENLQAMCRPCNSKKGAK